MQLMMVLLLLSEGYGNKSKYIAHQDSSVTSPSSKVTSTTSVYGESDHPMIAARKLAKVPS